MVKNIMKFAISLMAFFYTECAFAQNITFSKEAFSFANSTLPYRKADIIGNDDKASLVIYLHGGSSKGNDNETQLNEPAVDKISSWLYDNKKKAIMIVPQCPKDKSWLGTMLGSVKALLQQFVDKGVVDADRIYILGGSMGGTGTWNMLSAYPGFFAAAMPVAGNPTGLNAENVAQTPLFTVMGTDDAIMKISNVESFITEMDKYGASYCFEIEQGWTHENVCKESYTDERLAWVFNHDKETTNGISRTEVESASVISVSWYDLLDNQLSCAPQQKGIYIKHSTLGDGKIDCKKVMVN